VKIAKNAYLPKYLGWWR